MKKFADLIKKEIHKGLPGTEIQWQMASSDRMLKDFPRTPGKDSRVAAVLILLYPYNGSIYTVLMQRPHYDGVHSGQISFPGGKKEHADNNIIQTALREAHEETGVDSKNINLINTLTPLFIPVSDMIVTPVVGWLKERPVFNHQKEEVVFLIEADIRRLLDTAIVKMKPFDIGDEVIEVKYFDYDGNVIWGATAMILHELLTIIRNTGFKFANSASFPE
jgi:8-oxo-dGTP pyrophosphatase MutT (NUDIX family)